jgi:copper chaperone
MIKTTLKIDGMMCGMCESHVNDAVRSAFDVKKVSSSHSSGETEIISETAPDEAKLREVIEKDGYKVLSVSSEPYEKKGFALFGKK